MCFGADSQLGSASVIATSFFAHRIRLLCWAGGTVSMYETGSQFCSSFVSVQYGKPTNCLAVTWRRRSVIPLANARIMASLIRNCELHVVNDGHLFLISSAEQSAKVIRAFLESDEGGRHGKT